MVWVGCRGKNIWGLWTVAQTASFTHGGWTISRVRCSSVSASGWRVWVSVTVVIGGILVGVVLVGWWVTVRVMLE